MLFLEKKIFFEKNVGKKFQKSGFFWATLYLFVFWKKNRRKVRSDFSPTLLIFFWFFFQKINNYIFFPGIPSGTSKKIFGSPVANLHTTTNNFSSESKVQTINSLHHTWFFSAHVMNLWSEGKLLMVMWGCALDQPKKFFLRPCRDSMIECIFVYFLKK